MASKEEEIELGNYRVLKNGDGQNWELGKGAFGTTYKAEHKHLPRFCALKVINENLIRRSNSKQRFLQEAQAASLLDHPNIAQIYDFGESEGVFYYAMTYCAGHDLEHFAKAKGPQPWSSVKKMAKQIFSALVEAHGKGLLHRDIKPSNIMLTENDGTVNLKLIDFGLVKVLEQSSSHKTNVLLTNDGGFLGSPLTASPEQLNEEELDERSDLFSVGVTLWYLLVGGSPFDCTSTAQLVHQRLSEERYDKDLPADLEPNAVAILAKLLAKKKEDRYATAKEVLADLDETNLLARSLTDQTGDETGNDAAPAEQDQAVEAEALKERMEKVDADWSEIWEILSIVHQDMHGTLYNCVSKQDNTVRSSIFIPDPQESTYQEVITNCDAFVGNEVKILSPFVSKGVYDGEVCYLSTAYPIADVSLLIRQVGELGFSKYKHLFLGIANAIDEADTVGLPGVQLSHNEIKLAFSGQPLDLTEEQWIQYLNQGSSNITDLVNTLEVFIFPKFVDSTSEDDISMTLSNEDLATSTLSSFAGFIYSAVSGMKVKQSVYLTSSAHISTSNLSEESNDYLSKVIAAEIMPDSALGFLKQLSDLENISSDAAASIYSTQDMKRSRRDGLLEAHRSMSSMSQLPSSRAAETPAEIAASLAKTAATAATAPATPAEPPVDAIAKSTFIAKPLDSPAPEPEPVTAKKLEKKQKAPAKKKPVRAAEKRKDQPESQEKKQGGNKLKILLPAIVLLLCIGGYFAYPHLFPAEKKGSSSSSSDAETPTDNSNSSDTTNPDTSPKPSDPPDTPTVADGRKIYITIADMKGLDPQDSGKWMLSTEDGEALGEMKLEEKDGEKRFGITIPKSAYTSWTSQPLILKLKSPRFSIGRLMLQKSEFVESADDKSLVGSVVINVSKVITIIPSVKFAGKDYADSPELLREYLYPVDINLKLQKEVESDKITLLVPLDTTFPFDTQITLPGCSKVVKSISAEGGEVSWDIKMSKKTLSIYGLPSYDQLKFTPDFSSISNEKVREILSKAAASESVNPRKNEGGYTDVRIPLLKGELEIITQNGKQTIEINSDTVAKVLPDNSETYPATIKQLLASAEAGVTNIQYNLGTKLYEGDGVAQNLPIAAGWFTLAAKKGDDLARNNLAMMYLYGEGVAEDRRKAVKLFKMSSDEGDADAHWSLGLCYMKGLGVDKNVKEAVKYYEKAAAGGVAKAYADLGVIYADESFGVADIDKAIEYFTKGSDAGHGASSFNLGLMYSGEISQKKKDREKSILYYQKALKQGYAEAQKALELLNAPLE